MCGWGTTVIGGSGPGTHAATLSMTARVSASVPVSVSVEKSKLPVLGGLAKGGA